MERTTSLTVVLIVLMAVVPTFQDFFVYDQLFEGDSCTVNKTKGVCTSAMECPQSKQMLQMYRKHNLPRCNWKGGTEIVCCPQNTVNRVGGKARSELACEKYSAEYRIKVQEFIRGGEDALLGEFPHMAGIGYDNAGNITYSCGGALISERFILTAAHCVLTQSGVLPTVVKLGKVDIRGNSDDVTGDEYAVETSIMHPDYAPPQRYHDLALLRLLTNVTFGDNVSPACVFNEDTLPELPIPVATGWGDTTITQSDPSPILQKVSLPIVNLTHCNSSYTDDERRLPRGIVPTMICAGTGTGEADTCRGDSGGPLQIENTKYNAWTLIGVTSFGVGCGGNTVPGVYTRVSSYIKWIEDTVWPIT